MQLLLLPPVIGGLVHFLGTPRSILINRLVVRSLIRAKTRWYFRELLSGRCCCFISPRPLSRIQCSDVPRRREEQRQSLGLLFRYIIHRFV